MSFFGDFFSANYTYNKLTAADSNKEFCPNSKCLTFNVSKIRNEVISRRDAPPPTLTINSKTKEFYGSNHPFTYEGTIELNEKNIKFYFTKVVKHSSENQDFISQKFLKLSIKQEVIQWKIIG